MIQLFQYVKNMGETQRLLTSMLYRNGSDFLLGMLYRYCFLPVDVAQWHEPSNATTTQFSVALHSRHTVDGDTGEFIHEEINCLSDLLPESRSLATCSVCIMSDRSLTIRKLSEWVLTNNCTPLVSDYPQQNDSLSMTHEGGETAELNERPATGFLQDLEFCSGARSGIIGDSHQPSFLLLKELVEFERQIADDNSNAVDKLLHCELKQREPSGYNYGPNTPLFRHWSKLKPFKPVEVLQQYIDLHGTKVIVHQHENRQFTVASFSFDSCSIAANGTDQLYSFFNREYGNQLFEVHSVIASALLTILIMLLFRKYRTSLVHDFKSHTALADTGRRHRKITDMQRSAEIGILDPSV